MIRTIIRAEGAISQAGLESVLKQAQDIEILSSFSGLDQWAHPFNTDVADVWLVEDRNFEMPFSVPSESALIILTAIHDRRMLRQGLALGIRGLLPLAAMTAEIIAAVRATANGLLAIHADFHHELFSEELLFLETESKPLEILTSRETEVLSLLSLGMTNKAIAGQLHLSDHTIKFHVGSIFEKLRVSSRTEAVSVGIRQGLILL
jgi:two-component system, NarL family, response regulator YdfI